MDSDRLIELIEHWRTLAAEARNQGADSSQPTVLRAHAFGISDGLEIAANDLTKLLEAIESGTNHTGDAGDGERRS